MVEVNNGTRQLLLLQQKPCNMMLTSRSAQVLFSDPDSPHLGALPCVVNLDLVGPFKIVKF